MRKLLASFGFLSLTLVMVLGGCKRTDQAIGDNTEYSEENLFLSPEADEWRDNSLDMYSANILKPLQYTELEGAVYGGAEQYILGKGNAAVFKKHLFQEADNCWDELKVVSDEGNEVSYRLNFWEDKMNQAWAIGSIFDSSHYLMLDIEMDENNNVLYKFFEIDENMKVLRFFYVDGLDKKSYEFPDQILVDTVGTIHIITYRESDDTSHYYVISSDGAVLTEVQKIISVEQNPNLFYLSDGQVGLCIDNELFLANVESGKTTVLAEWEENRLKCILWDEETLLYADRMGVHRCNLSGGETETLYTWKNHGITPSKIVSMQLSEKHEISILYVAQEGVNYLKLVPTTEEVEILEIEFAVSSLSSQKYHAAVMDFNRKHPTWHIEMKEYEVNDTGLITELIAGDGPQLLDTVLTGFQEYSDLWEPLNDFYSQFGLDKELIPQTLEFSKIGGTSYGIVTDFCISTMVTFSKSPDVWDYGTFLDYLMKDNDATKSVFNPVNGSDGYSFASMFFHDLDETFLYDAENCITKFDSEEFQKILELAKHYMSSENQANAEDLRQGTPPCAVVRIRQPEDLACLRIWGENCLRYVGLPSQKGSVHYLEGANPLSLRINATMEEKRLAFAFLSYLLSYDVQKEQDNTYTQWSVRKDILEEQMNRMSESSVTCLAGFPQFQLGNQVNSSEDYETLCKLLENASCKKNAPKELTHIWAEEMNDYLSETISEEALKEHLKGRIELYLMEQKN